MRVEVFSVGMLHFLGTARPKRENWLQTITEAEKAIMAEHFGYVNKLYEDGGIVFSGACTDGAMGTIIYQAESEEDARKMFEADPLTKSGITHTEFHPFKIGHKI